MKIVIQKMGDDSFAIEEYLATGALVDIIFAEDEMKLFKELAAILDVAYVEKWDKSEES